MAPSPMFVHVHLSIVSLHGTVHSDANATSACAPLRRSAPCRRALSCSAELHQSHSPSAFTLAGAFAPVQPTIGSPHLSLQESIDHRPEFRGRVLAAC